MHRLLIIPGLALLASCTDLGSAPEYGLLADHSNITDPALRWEAYRIEDYSILQRRDCFCPGGGHTYLVTVRSGNIAGVIDQADGSVLPADRRGVFRTIPGLFALIRSIDTAHVASFHASYDARYGYPTLVSVDPNAQVADEEYAYSTSNLH